MTTEFGRLEYALSHKKQTSSIPLTLASCAVALSIILGTAAMVIWPVSMIEGWNSDSLITLMLVVAFFLLLAACHYFDCDDERKGLDSGKSL